MKQNIWCKFFRLHKYEVFKEEPYLDVKGNVIGKVYVNRCINCGKLDKQIVFIEEGHGNYR